jgi:murein DD-endopeptidase MepM/ murein hydrolase activator NlpD
MKSSEREHAGPSIRSITMSIRGKTTQMAQYLSNSRLRRNRWFLPLAAIVTTLVVLFNWPQIANGAERVADRLVLYIHVAELYTKDPDRKLAMPLAEVERKQVANTWHAPRGGNRLHEGQDIFAPQGTPIYSATAGYVLSVGENGLGGQTVSVAGAGGRVYYYAHLDCYASDLHEGDRVTTRTILGYVGTTGNAAGTPPHLHFGIYTPTGGAIDPLPLLSDRVKPKPAETKPAKKKQQLKRKGR